MGRFALKLPGYELREALHASETSFVCRAKRLPDGKNVVVKRSVGTSLSPRQFTRYRNEYELLRELECEGVVKAHELIRHEGHIALIVDDFGGISLKKWFLSCDSSLEARLEIAVQLAVILAKVHAAGIIHKDVNPHNVLYDAVSKRCTLIDFGIATRLVSEESLFKFPAALEGTLAYMAPEQTGRMNRNFDCRADLYSLGVTYYELFTGSLPREETDPLETIHFHLAGTPTAPCERDEKVPPALSKLIMKLLQKAPEQRYQSAAGVAADLGRCLELLRATGAIAEFELAEHDVLDRFEPPQRLYGRADETAAMVQAFERAASGGVETILVAGPAGIGKTSLVQELHEPITRRRGYFAAGKFDQLRRDVPLSGLASALQDLVQQILTENDDAIAAWKAAIEDAVGANGRLIADLVPAVELIIGPQPPLRELDAAEERNRFNLAFRSFIQVFGRKDHPLVLFLDDVQWADATSLALITMVLSARDTESLLLVQAYRDNEVSAGHPLLMAVEDQRDRGVAVVNVKLEALGTADIAEFVAEALREDVAAAAPLAEIMSEKTGGNPFFVRQFLQTLHAEKLIAFDPATNAFRYDVASIQAAGITENVVELLAAKLQKLPAATRRVLQLAAAIGYRFDLDSLATIYEHSLVEAAEHLHPALRDGLIVPLSELESLDSGALDSPLVYRRFSFLHDRVRQIAYAAIPEGDRAALHLALGRALLADSDGAELDNRLFAVVNHMNQGLALITNSAEALRLAQLNAMAGAKAKVSTAYSMAVQSYSRAAEILGESAWEERYELCYDVHARLAESLWLKADFSAAFEVIEAAVQRAASDVDKARLYTLKTTVYLSRGDMPESLACGRRAAKLVSIELPDDHEQIQQMLQVEIDAILRRTSAIGIEELIDLPVMHDTDKVAAMALLTHCLPAAYQSDQQLFALICCKMVGLSLDHGNCALSARAYGSFAALLSTALGEYRDAYRFAKLGVEVCRRLDDPTMLSAAYFLWALFASHWNKPVDESIELFRQSAQHGLQTGDHQHAGYGTARRIAHLQFRGAPIPELRNQAEEAWDVLNRIGDVANLDFLAPRIQFIEWLAAERPKSNGLSVWGLFEEAVTAAIKKRGNRSFEADWYTLLVTQRYLSGDFEAALAFAEEAKDSQFFCRAFVSRVEHEFYCALTWTAIYEGSGDERRKELDSRLSESERQLGTWAEVCAENFSHMHLLVRAEMARIHGDARAAMNLYDRAIVAASNQGFINIEAVASELAAKFWFAQDKADFGRMYLQRAVHAYEIWGANVKVVALRGLYGDEVLHATATTQTTGATIGTAAERSDALDLATVLKASQAIAGEIVLDKLLATLLDIILENAGAESGSLILESEGKYLVQASKDTSASDSIVMAATPLSRSEALSPGIVYYVIRTQEQVVLSDPAERGNFRSDPYVRDRRPKSVLCVPIVHKGELTGVLYLENNQVAGAFTPHRLEALNILLSQIAVSIENAQLYAGQEQQRRLIERANVELTKEIKERERAEGEIRRYRDHLEDLVKARTAELESAQGRLVDLSRRAGMAEVAAGVLHNVGNVMNSVNVGASMTRDAVKTLSVERLSSVCDLLEDHAETLADYLVADATGRKVPDYLRKLANALVEDKGRILTKIEHVLEHIEHMKKIIGAQQTYAKTSGVMEVCTLAEIAETAISISEVALRNSGIEIVREYHELPPVSVDRHQIMQILVNLISNAKHALEDRGSADRKLVVRIAVDQDEGVRMEVEDNGVGIGPENLTRIFSHGFTTKKNGHGFGLHNCANGAQQMNGSLTAHSEGPGLGAKFVLRVPVEYATYTVQGLKGDSSDMKGAAAG